MHSGNPKPFPGGQEQLVKHEPFSGPRYDCFVKMPLVAPWLIPPIVKTERAVAIHVKLWVGFDCRVDNANRGRIARCISQLEAVKADRKLVDDAIEESLRWNPTDPVFSRLVAHDTQLEGVPLAAGSVLEICLGAANRDPTRWDSPDSYNLHRPQQSHLGFGVGTHLCLGRDVGRSEIHVGLNALLDAFPNLRLDPHAPAPHLTGGLEQRGMSAVPVLLR